MANLSIIGSKCWPNSYGGFESLVENLLNDKNFLMSFERITVYVEEYDSQLANQFSNVQFVRLSIKKAERPLRYYLQSLYLARRDDFNLILGLAAGVSLPFFKIFNRKTKYIVNVDGIEWRRSKFNYAKRALLYSLNILSVIFSHKVILDSKALPEDNGILNFKKENIFIPYSSRFEGKDQSLSCLETEDEFVLGVSRFVPENNIEMICEGWTRFTEESHNKNYKFFFIGDFENYAIDLAKRYPNIDFLGPIFELDKLAAYFDNCKAYLHGHSVGGTNPVLVEAISKNCTIYAHDNAYNKDTLQGNGAYFSNAEELASLLALRPKVVDLSDFYNLNFSSEVIAKRYINAIRQ